MYKSSFVYGDPVEGNCIQASTQLKASAGTVYGAVVAAGSDTATLIIYDSTTESGERELVLKATAGTSAVFTPFRPIKCRTGIYASVAGTAPYATILYD